MNDKPRRESVAARPATPEPARAPEHVIVIGAGIVGVATAIRLRRGARGSR